ncbi:hypothetical protein Tco_0417075 [Tanacetum coccineum]
MSNTNNTLQTQTSNALHNAIMESGGGKDRPPMLASGNYVQWKSRLKRYIDTKQNKELLHHCLNKPPYEFQWIPSTITVAEDGTEIITPGHMEAYHNVPKEIRDQLDAEAETVQIILTRIDNDISTPQLMLVQMLFGKFTSRDGESLESYYSRFYKMMNELVRNKYEISNHQVNVQFLLQLQPEWKRSQPAATRNRRKAIAYSPPPTYDQAPIIDADDDEMSKEKDIDKLMALISLSFKKIYKPTNNNLRTSSNTSRANQDNYPRVNRGTGNDNQMAVNVARAKETVGTQVV